MNTLNHEIQALRNWGQWHGEDIPGEAFGCGWRIDTLTSLKARDYPFEIRANGQELVLWIDGYTALGLRQDEGFDSGKWNDMRMKFVESNTRKGYTHLAWIARTLVAGNTLHLGDGCRVKLAWLMSSERADAPWFLED